MTRSLLSRLSACSAVLALSLLLLATPAHATTSINHNSIVLSAAASSSDIGDMDMSGGHHMKDGTQMNGMNMNGDDSSGNHWVLTAVGVGTLLLIVGALGVVMLRRRGILFSKDQPENQAAGR